MRGEKASAFLLVHPHHGYCQPPRAQSAGPATCRLPRAGVTTGDRGCVGVCVQRQRLAFVVMVLDSV